MNRIREYIKQDNKINLKLGAVIVVCFTIGYVIVLTRSGGIWFWLSNLLNAVGCATLGCGGIVAIIRNERTPFMQIPFLSPKMVGIITAIIGFGGAIVIIGFTLYFASGGSF